MVSTVWKNKKGIGPSCSFGIEKILNAENTM